MENGTNFIFNENNFNSLCVNESNANDLKTAGIVAEKSAIFVYFVWYPVVSIIGIVHNFISIIILKKQFKNKPVYHMQLIVMIFDLAISIVNLSSVFSPLLLNASPGPNWIKSSFGLFMFIILEGFDQHYAHNRNANHFGNQF